MWTGQTGGYFLAPPQRRFYDRPMVAISPRISNRADHATAAVQTSVATTLTPINITDIIN
jgi:hypothetical protein